MMMMMMMMVSFCLWSCSPFSHSWNWLICTLPRSIKAVGQRSSCELGQKKKVKENLHSWDEGRWKAERKDDTKLTAVAHVSSLSQQSWQVDCSGQALTGYPVSYLNALSFICHLPRKEQREPVPIWWAGSYWHIISFSPKAPLGLLKAFPSLFLCLCMWGDTYLPKQLSALEKCYS